MPKRLFCSTFRVDSAKIQGDGSFVVFRRLTWAEMRPIWDMETGAGMALMKQSIQDWNWVDDEGQPLPNPHDHPEVLDTLAFEETNFLLLAAQGKQSPDQEEEKN